ncbi:MAG: phage baseplate assembly protein V [Myxococcota bacterium]
MATQGLTANLQELLADGRVWVSLGQVIEVETDSTWGYLFTVTLQPDGIDVQARPLWPMGGAAGEGSFHPIAVDDEVLVLCPQGDLNQAVILAGLSSIANPVPAGFNNDRGYHVYAKGSEFRTADTDVVQATVTEDLLSDLQAALTEVSGFMKAFGVPTVNLDALLAKLPTLYRSTALKTS